MRQSLPYEFQSAAHLIEHLSKRKAELANWFERRQDSLHRIVNDSVGSNTFRAFRLMPRQPSVVFREWACGKVDDPSVISVLGRVGAQPEYDTFVNEFCGTLNADWQQHMGEPMPYGPRRKLPNLLLKEIAVRSGWTDSQRQRLTRLLHIPLDKFTLVGIRRCIDDLEIPKTATMKFVAGQQMYDQIQTAIRSIAAKADVPAIYFDVLAWNMSH